MLVEHDDDGPMIPFWSRALVYETTLVFSIRPSNKIFKFSITREYSSFEHQFPGIQDLIRENGLRIRIQAEDLQRAVRGSRGYVFLSKF
jgi:hypothetical protein